METRAADFTGDSAGGHRPPLQQSWKETIREMERECAKAWLESARFWRSEAVRHFAAGNDVLAAEALLNAVIRETYAAEDMAKAEVGGQKKAECNSALR